MPYPNGLVAHWLLNETSGTSAYDYVGGFTGTLVNTPTPTTGKINGGLQLNGTDEYVNIDTVIAGISTLTSGTISLWFKRTGGDGNWRYIFSASDGGDADSNVGIYLTSSNTIRFRVAENAATKSMWTSTATYTDSNWHHLNWSVSATSGTIIVIDGTADPAGTWNTVANAAAAIYFFSSVNDLDASRLGCLYTSSANGQYIPGILDDIRIYNRALSLPEIMAIYNGGYGTELSDPAGAGGQLSHAGQRLFSQRGI